MGRISDIKGGAAREARQTLDRAVSEALQMIRRSRDYVYAVLPEGKQDERLQEYGFETVVVNGRRRKKAEEPQSA